MRDANSADAISIVVAAGDGKGVYQAREYCTGGAIADPAVLAA
jgi:hypothetical protein